MNTGDVSLLVNDTHYNLGSKTFWYFFGKNSLTGFVFLIIALIISIIRSYSGGNPEIASALRIASWFSFIIAVIGFIAAFISSKMIYKNTGFTLGEDALIISHGVFTKEEFAIPYRQIQNIEIERTLGNQMMGISRLMILTAGEETEEEKKRDDPEGVFPVIDKEIAISLENELLKRANIQKVISVK